MAESVGVVTGVSKGLGEAIAADLLGRGFHVIGIGRSAAKRLDAPAFRLVVADLADVGALGDVVGPLFDDLATRRPAVIAVINNAAIAGPVGTVGQLEGDEIVESLAINLAAPTIVADAFVRAFRSAAGDRRLINVSSGAAAGPIAGAGIYSMAKCGLEMLTSAIATEQPAGGLRAITIRPGIIDTPMQQSIRSQSADRLPSLPMFKAFHEQRQLVAPDVVAGKIVERLVIGAIESGRVYSYAEL